MLLMVDQLSLISRMRLQFRIVRFLAKSSTVKSPPGFEILGERPAVEQGGPGWFSRVGETRVVGQRPGPRHRVGRDFVVGEHAVPHADFIVVRRRIVVGVPGGEADVEGTDLQVGGRPRRGRDELGDDRIGAGRQVALDETEPRLSIAVVVRRDREADMVEIAERVGTKFIIFPQEQRTALVHLDAVVGDPAAGERVRRCGVRELEERGVVSGVLTQCRKEFERETPFRHGARAHLEHGCPARAARERNRVGVGVPRESRLAAVHRGAATRAVLQVAVERPAVEERRGATVRGAHRSRGEEQENG